MFFLSGGNVFCPDETFSAPLGFRSVQIPVNGSGEGLSGKSKNLYVHGPVLQISKKDNRELSYANLSVRQA
jgi:hypothetical protein